MKRVMFETFGDPAVVLKAVDAPMPEPGPGQVRLKMRMAPIHNHDEMIVAGAYGVLPDLPHAPGTEGLGIVDKLGEGVTNLTVGQRVTGGGSGTWSEYYLGDGRSLVPLPDAVSDETGCQLLSMPMSAFRLLGNLDVKAGDWVIQNAANGLVGIIFAKLAAALGVRVVNLVRREAAIAELAAEGIGDAVSSEHADWPERVRAVTGGAPIIRAIDSISGQAADDLMNTVAEDGWLISFGALSGEPIVLRPQNLLFKRATVKGFWGARPELVVPREALMAQAQAFVQQAARGELKLPVSAAFDLTQTAEAATAHANAGRGGKIAFRGMA